MGRKIDELIFSNSGQRKRYIELFALQNAANHAAMRTSAKKVKFRNSYLREQLYAISVFVLLLLYLVALWRKWDTTSLCLMALMAIFELIAMISIFNNRRQILALQKKLSGSIQKVQLKQTTISSKLENRETELKWDDLQNIIVTKYNIVFLAQAHADEACLYFDRENLKLLEEKLDEYNKRDLLKYAK